MSEAATETRQCAACPQLFTPRSDTALACSPRCAMRLVSAKKRAAAAERRATRERLLDLRPRAAWLAIAQRTFNAWILIRDAGLPCVSCGRLHKGKFNAGHYIAAGDAEALRFDESNVWAQCVPCNHKRHGDLVRFRQELVRRIGPDGVARLENFGPDRLFTVDELKAIIALYRAKIRAASPAGK